MNKTKLIICSVLGLLAAGAFWFLLTLAFLVIPLCVVVGMLVAYSLATKYDAIAEKGRTARGKVKAMFEKVKAVFAEQK